MTAAEPAMSATRAAFDAAFAKQTAGGASCSVTKNGREVLTLWAGEARPGVPWTRDTRTVTMSIAKTWTSLIAMMLVDRGQLDPDERVTTYWPEFGANGKEATLVSHVLLHTCGALGPADVAAVFGWDGRGWGDLDAIAAALAAAPPAWEPGTRHGYHATSYGWLVGELVRRIDGRTVGEFLAAEIAEPLGLRLAIGVPEHEQADLATVLNDAIDKTPFPMSLLASRARKQMRDPSTLLGKASLGDGTHSIFDTPGDLVNNPRWIAAEMPASNGVTSAADLARLFAVLAGGGELDGVRLVSEATLDRMLTRLPPMPDAVMGSLGGRFLGPRLAKTASAHRALGGSLNPPDAKSGYRYGPGGRTVTGGGYGGQMAIADPDAGLSVAFVRSQLRMSEAEVIAIARAVYDDLD